MKVPAMEDRSETTTPCRTPEALDVMTPHCETALPSWSWPKIVAVIAAPWALAVFLVARFF